MSSEEKISLPTQRTPLLINRDFALLWGGQAISNLGDVIFDTTLMLWIATRIASGFSWTPLAVSGVLLATSLPTILLGPLAGVLVDRWDTRRTMLWADVLRSLLIALLLVGVSGTPLPFAPFNRLPLVWQLGSIYGVVFWATVFAQFFNPARIAIIGRLVMTPDRTRASALTQTTMNLAMLLGPAIAAPLFLSVGIHWALGLNAFSFTASWCTILAIRSPQSQRVNQPKQDAWNRQVRTLVRDFIQGIRFYRSNRVLMVLAVTIILVVPAEGALNTLDIFFVRQNLHTSLTFYGVLGSAFGIGLIIGSGLAVLVARYIRLARIFWVSLMLEGLVVLTYARLTQFAAALGILVIYGLLVGMVNVALMPLLLHVTPSELVGRVTAMLTPLATATLMVSSIVAGYVDSTVLQGFHATVGGITIGPVDTIFSAAACLILAGGAYAMIVLRAVSGLRTRGDQMGTSYGSALERE